MVELPFLLRERQLDLPPDPEGDQDRVGCSVIPEEHPGGRRLRMLPPACLPDALPHLSTLGEPGPALAEKVAAGLLLPATAPPALVRLVPLYLIGQVCWPRSRRGQKGAGGAFRATPFAPF